MYELYILLLSIRVYADLFIFTRACDDSTPHRGAGWEPNCIRTVRAKIESLLERYRRVVVVAALATSWATRQRGLS